MKKALQILKEHGDWMNGRRLRHLVNKGASCWNWYSGPSFYLNMAILADQGKVEQMYTIKTINGVDSIRVPRFRIKKEENYGTCGG